MSNGKKIKTHVFLGFFIAFFIVLLIILLVLPKSTLAQETDTLTNQRLFCAKRTYCSDEGNKPYIEGTCTVKHGHRVKLEVDPTNPPRPDNNETYLVECLSPANNGAPDFKCTTGSSELDLEALGYDYYSWLVANWHYALERDINNDGINDGYGIFKVDNNQAVRIGPKRYKTGPSGNLIFKENNEPVSVIEWQSFVNVSNDPNYVIPADHKFYIFQKIQPQSATELGQGGEQLGTSSDWVNTDGNCAIVRWDPAGRVFDAFSLEPIPGASVFLTKDDGRGNFVNASQFEMGIINPQSTNPQGGFGFYVSDGNYKLNINNLVSLGYQRLASNLTEVNSKYSQIYYHLVSGLKKTFIYPAQTGEIIHQRGKMEYRDIPLIPSGNVGKTYPLKVLSAFYSVNKSSGKVTLEGSVSHPFTQIIIYGVDNATSTASLTDNNKQKIYQGITDNLGNYKIIFSQEEKGRIYNSFVVDFQKTDLTTIAKKNSLLAKIISWLPIKKSVVFAQTEAKDKVSLRLDPIPNYLEGVARDPSGKVLANSQVKIYIKGINLPYTVGHTDDQGYFKISSSSLPFFPYEIKYQKSSGTVVTVSTSKFIADNRSLISSKKINLYSFRDSQGKSMVLTPKITKSPSVAVSTSEKWGHRSGLGGQEKPLPTKRAQATSSSLSSGTVLILAIIFFLLILVGVIVYFYFRQKKSSSTLV